MSKLHIFDMDGTILEGSACVHISQHLGCYKEICIIEEAWCRGEVGHVEFWELCLPLWKELDGEKIEEVFQKSPWKKNIAKVFEDISARGEFSAVITLSPQFFVRHLLKWGANTTHGAEVYVDKTLDPELVTTPEHKVLIARKLLESYGVDESNCIAYGDSSSDIPLFTMLSKSVAVNGSERLQPLATACYNGDDIWEAYQIGRKLAES